MYELIGVYGSDYGIQQMCEALGISRSSYYAYRDISAPSRALEEAVIELFWRHKRRYGSRRLVVELASEGFEVGRDRVRAIMKKNHLVAIQPKRFVPKTTQSDPTSIRSPNLLLGRPLPTAPNEVWVGDITYLPKTQGGWYYLASWMDLYSRYIVGWEIADHMRASLVIQAFQKGIRLKQPSSNLIVHSDGGGQYEDKEFRQMLADLGCLQSMTRPNNVYDNSFAESLFSRYKAELLEGGAFEELEEAKMETFEYFEQYYNPIRRHSALGYLSPKQFEQKWELINSNK